MKELIIAALSAPNIIPTALLGLVVVYWITVMLGALDFEFLDFDIDAALDAEVEMDMSAAAETEVHAQMDISWFNSVLIFFNLNKVPFMIFFTMLILPVWIVCIMLNDYLGINSFPGGLIILIPSIFVSLFIAKILTIPFAHLFAHMEKEESESKSAVGKICIASNLITDHKIGQAKIKTSGSPILLNVITDKGNQLQTGESGLVIKYLKDRNIYLVAPYNT